MRRLLVAVIALAVVLVAVDRVAELVVARSVAGRLRTAEHLGRDPAVSFRGFPFLTQALRGRFADVSLSTTGVREQALTIARIDAHLRGVHLSPSDALAGRLRSVRIDRADGSALLRYSDLTSLLAQTVAGTVPGGAVERVTLHDAGGRLAARGDVRASGQVLPVEVVCEVAVDGSEIRITPRTANLPFLGAQTLSSSTQAQLRVTIPTDRLPFGLRVRTVTVGADGLSVHGDAARFDSAA